MYVEYMIGANYCSEQVCVSIYNCQYNSSTSDTEMEKIMKKKVRGADQNKEILLGRLKYHPRLEIFLL